MKKGSGTYVLLPLLVKVLMGVFLKGNCTHKEELMLVLIASP